MATVNVLLSTYSGLGLPDTVCWSIPADESVVELRRRILHDLLPRNAAQQTYCTLTDGTDLDKLDPFDPIQTLCGTTDCHFLPVHLNVRLRGGKGGFGSQLRAAGGRMSSRKRKQNAQEATGSARNLDGRRLRTVVEAKNLANYLATKPEMDRKEKEERRKRWEAVVELAEQREADMKAGKTIDGQRKGISSEWLEEKDEINENIKNAVRQAAMASTNKVTISDSESSSDSDSGPDADGDEPMELDQDDMARLRREAEAGDPDAMWVLKERLGIPSDLLPTPKAKSRYFADFDEEEEEDERITPGRDLVV